MTSRPKRYLQSALRNSSIIHISLQKQLVDADILSYLRHRLNPTSKYDKKQEVPEEKITTHSPRSIKLSMANRPKQYLQSALRGSSIVRASLQERLVDIPISSRFCDTSQT